MKSGEGGETRDVGMLGRDLGKPARALKVFNKDEGCM